MEPKENVESSANGLPSLCLSYSREYFIGCEATSHLFDLFDPDFHAALQPLCGLCAGGCCHVVWWGFQHLQVKRVTLLQCNLGGGRRERGEGQQHHLNKCFFCLQQVKPSNFYKIVISKKYLPLGTTGFFLFCFVIVRVKIEKISKIIEKTMFFFLIYDTDKD